MVRPLQIFSSLVLCALFSLPLSSWAATKAIDDVRTTVDEVLTVLRDKATPAAQRREKIRNLVRGRFDFELMARSTLGRQWKAASKQEQETFIELYSKLLEATYVGRIEAYTSEKVTYGSEKTKGDKALVETNIVTASVEIPIEYKLVQNETDWKVYDVVIEGVSLIRNFRSSYGSIVEKEGFPGLFARMESKVKELEQ
jgi:phospholipid transport system substrate-binding protein